MVFVYIFFNIFSNPISTLINGNPKVVCLDCCGEAHLNVCSNAVGLGSILYSLGLN